jgi:hypothetical protein
MDLLLLREAEGVGIVDYGSYEPSLSERMLSKNETNPEEGPIDFIFSLI